MKLNVEHKENSSKMLWLFTQQSYLSEKGSKFFLTVQKRCLSDLNLTGITADIVLVLIRIFTEGIINIDFWKPHHLETSNQTKISTAFRKYFIPSKLLRKNNTNRKKKANKSYKNYFVFRTRILLLQVLQNLILWDNPCQKFTTQTRQADLSGKTKAKQPVQSHTAEQGQTSKT